MREQQNQSQILLYQTADGRSRIEVCLQDSTVWLYPSYSKNWFSLRQHLAF